MSFLYSGVCLLRFIFNCTLAQYQCAQSHACSRSLILLVLGLEKNIYQIMGAFTQSGMQIEHLHDGIIEGASENCSFPHDQKARGRIDVTSFIVCC